MLAIGHSLQLCHLQLVQEHCRSYQCLVLSVVNIKNKDELSISLLDSFLGAFEQASTSYDKWACNSMDCGGDFIKKGV
ncbi:hypothetical protein L211DRAFT_885739 [Terfezia boudieri ATCC MYA-4762]|uniref:Uncharacterized protein n=1 Tax=Terfezia boudieri ATCC MYA-4762 TaxID=1051890 RepID=A0A3N4LGV5_9PEZI|nr:hypothetical protein L211DRAFT_885739 [Terfezia boudieri ATCC MYA-4762]